MTKHRMTKSPEYQAWCHAKRRCNDPKNKEFKRYGAKGIRVSPLWVDNFEAFFQEVGLRPSPRHSLDRKDGTKGYEPGNVRWATKELQSQNRPEFVRSISYRGKTQTVAEWSRELGLTATTIYARLDRGLSAEAALSLVMLPGKSHRMLTHQGETLPLKTWARRLGMVATTIRERLERGWPTERALTPR